MFQQWLQNQNPEELRKWFYLGQISVGGVFVLFLLYLRSRPEKSQFRYREADRLKAGNKKSSKGQSEPSLADARMTKKETLRLTGIVLDGAPHEILGVPASATLDQVQKAYRDMMKRYHPDKVGRPGSREWNDAQKIAETINRAKEEMLKAVHSRSPNRSGR